MAAETQFEVRSLFLLFEYAHNELFFVYDDYW